MATHNEIALLRLAPRAKTGAVLLNEKFPFIKFTSGLRDLRKQAEVMATNAMREKNWIGSTYRLGGDLQKLIDKNWLLLTSHTVMSNFIFDYMARQTEKWITDFSRHLGGHAFDVLPLVDSVGIPTADGWKVVDFMRLSIGAEKVLLREGGQIIWHVQFSPTEEV